MCNLTLSVPRPRPGRLRWTTGYCIFPGSGRSWSALARLARHPRDRRQLTHTLQRTVLLLELGYGGCAQRAKYRRCSGGGSRPRSALRIQTPPLQRRTHRTPGCAPLKRRRHSPARSTCAAAPVLRSSPLGADMVGKSRNMSSDMLFTPGLLGLMPPTICCVRSQSVRDFVTEISAVPPVRYGSEL